MAEKLPIVEEALKRAGKNYIEYLQDELENQSHVASGKLSNGFYVRVHNTSKGLRMDVMNNVSYMYTVNDGASGVTASYSALEAWTNQKVARGELNFSSESRKKYFINKVKSELEKKYLTDGGEKVAPQRYFFIDIAFENANQQGVGKNIEDSVGKEIDSILRESGSFKAIQLTI